MWRLKVLYLGSQCNGMLKLSQVMIHSLNNRAACENTPIKRRLHFANVSNVPSRLLFARALIYVVNETALRPLGLYYGLYFIIHTLQKLLLIPRWFPPKLVPVLSNRLRAELLVSTDSMTSHYAGAHTSSCTEYAGTKLGNAVLLPQPRHSAIPVSLDL